MNLAPHEVLLARERIRSRVRETPLEHSVTLSADRTEVFLKLENFQLTGSFKLRGAMNKLLVAGPAATSMGVVAASAGNHGAGVAYGARQLGCKAVIFVPETISPVRLDAIRGYGAEVVPRGDDCVVAERAARALAAEKGMTYISPYNDPAVVAGQGTIGAEIAEQMDSLDAVYVALGGGGLIGGIASYLKGIGRDLEIIACSPENSRVMHESVAAGAILDLPSQPTLSESTAGGIEEGAITFDLCRDLVDRFVLVSESEIKAATRSFIEQHHMLIEGAAGVAVAGFLSERKRQDGKKVALVICGANISREQLMAVLAD